jgi:hypothetical protein
MEENMARRIRIMDYANEWHDTGIDVEDDVVRISIEVITGDHVATFCFSNGLCETVDSCFDRLHDYHDGKVVIYDKDEGIDLLDQYDKIEETYDIFDLEGADDNRFYSTFHEWLGL